MVKCQCSRKVHATYGIKNGKALWCKSCPTKPSNAVDVLHTKCDCGKARATLGLEKGKPIWCAKCESKPINAVNVVDKTCQCGKSSRPSLGLLGGKPKWCGLCPSKPSNAVNVRNKKCLCNKKAQPVFGLEYGNAIWCSVCPLRPENSFDVKSKRCECKKSQPTFGLEDGKVKWCASCPQKPDNAVDKKHKKCECGLSRPSYGMEIGKPIWCTLCKQENSFDVIHTNCECGKSRASFGVELGKPIWCVLCKTLSAYDVVNASKLCKKEGCDTRVYLKYDYCSTHDPESRSRRASKQSKVYQFLLDNLPENLKTAMKQEKTIGNECGFKRYRRDFIIPLADRTINIEIDEFEHGKKNSFYDFRGSGQYTAPCEVKRMYEVAVEDGGTYLQIRFNTDVQRKRDGTPIPKIEKKRLEMLNEVIQKYSVMKNPSQFMVTFMFYSEDRFEELQNQFVNGGEDDWVGMGEDVKQYLNLVS